MPTTRVERDMRTPTASPGSGDSGHKGWRDVSPKAYRRANLLTVPLGVVLLAIGLWDLAHAHLARGLVLVAIGFLLGIWTAVLRIEGMPASLYRPGLTREQVLRDRRAGAGSAGTEAWAPRVLHFYTRKECLLCHEARVRMTNDLGDAPVTIVDHDVDRDPALATMYGNEIPVAIYEGKTVYAMVYDADAVRAVAQHARGETG